MARPNPQNLGKYESLVLAVATGVPVVERCRTAGVSRSMVSGWQEDPGFDRDVAALRRRLLNEAIGKFTGAVTQVAEGMIALAESAMSEPTKLSAQKAVIDHMIQVTEFAELRDRLKALEEWRASQHRDAG